MYCNDDKMLLGKVGEYIGSCVCPGGDGDGGGGDGGGGGGGGGDGAGGAGGVTVVVVVVVMVVSAVVVLVVVAAAIQSRRWSQVYDDGVTLLLFLSLLLPSDNIA